MVQQTQTRTRGRPPAQRPAQQQPAPQVINVANEFTITESKQSNLKFPKAPALGDLGSKYDPLIAKVLTLQVGDACLVLTPIAPEDAKQLRNRITGPVRKKAQPYANGRLRIRLTDDNKVAILCEEHRAEVEATPAATATA